MNDDKRLSVPDQFGIVVVDPAAFPDLDNAPVGINIDPKYHEFQTGEEVRGIYCGTQTRKIKNKPTPTAIIQTKTGFLMNSGVALVDQLKSLRPGTPVQVKMLGKKDVGDGARVNTFQVNILNVGPVQTQNVSMPDDPPPSSPPAPAPAPVPETKKPIAFNRPLDPATLREKLLKKADILKSKEVVFTQADRGIVAKVLEMTFGGDKDKRRKLTEFLVGTAHIKDMSQAQVGALRLWLECPNFDSVPPEYVIKEARSSYEAAVTGR